MTIDRLTDDAITAGLAKLTGWEREGDAIVKRYRFADFDAAMRFVNRAADVARALDHHPELFNVYDRVDLRLTTHDADGITTRDLSFAERVDRAGGD